MPIREKFGQARHRPEGVWVQTSHLEEVMGLHHRKVIAASFFHAVRKCERRKATYGLLIERQPNNPHDANAIAVIGVAMTFPWFRKPMIAEFPLGFVRRELAAEISPDLIDQGIAVRVELYSLYQSGDYMEIKYLLLAPPGYGVKKRQRDRDLIVRRD